MTIKITWVFRSCTEILSSKWSIRAGMSLPKGTDTISCTPLGEATDIALYSWFVSNGALRAGRFVLLKDMETLYVILTNDLKRDEKNHS